MPAVRPANLIRLGLFGALCAIGIAAPAQSREPLGSFGNGLDIFLLPETIASIDGAVRQGDIVIVHEKSADGTAGETVITGKVQVNCAARQARMIDVKAVKLAAGDEKMSEFPENSPWLDLLDSPEDQKIHQRLCPPAAAPS